MEQLVGGHGAGDQHGPLPLRPPLCPGLCLSAHRSQARCAKPEGSLLLSADGCLGLAKETLSSVGKTFQLGFPGSLAYGGLGVECWSLQDPRDGMEP